MPPADHLILIIEDEPPIRRFLRAALAHEGYRLNEAASGQEGLRVATSQPPDLVILDLGLPDIDGQEVLRQLREWLTAPIIILSARDQEVQKIKALDNGADDYVTKPFGMDELLARMRASLRRSVQEAPEPVFRIGGLEVDLGHRRVTVDGREVQLTPTEYELLRLFVSHPGRVITHRQALGQVWGPAYAGQSHLLRVTVSNLRRKLEPEPARPHYILTEPGVGYRMLAEDQDG